MVLYHYRTKQLDKHSRRGELNREACNFYAVHLKSINLGLSDSCAHMKNACWRTYLMCVLRKKNTHRWLRMTGSKQWEHTPQLLVIHSSPPLSSAKTSIILNVMRHYETAPEEDGFGTVFLSSFLSSLQEFGLEHLVCGCGAQYLSFISFSVTACNLISACLTLIRMVQISCKILENPNRCMITTSTAHLGSYTAGLREGSSGDWIQVQICSLRGGGHFS